MRPRATGNCVTRGGVSKRWYSTRAWQMLKPPSL
jgi:hypothetical protein